MTSKALTLAEASRLVGRPRGTLIRAIEAGLIAAHRGADGSYTIEPGELERRRADWDISPSDRRRLTDRADGESFGV